MRILFCARIVKTIGLFGGRDIHGGVLVNAITDYRYGYANAVGVLMFLFGLVILWLVNRLFRMDETDY